MEFVVLDLELYMGGLNLLTPQSVIVNKSSEIYEFLVDISVLSKFISNSQPGRT